MARGSSEQCAEEVRAAFEAADNDTRNALMAHDMRLYIALCYLVETPKAEAWVRDRLARRSPRVGSKAPGQEAS